MANAGALHLGGRPFLKGHGTQNDFVLLPDVDGTLTLTPAAVRRLCDRRQGLGADGVLRVVPVALDPAAPAQDASGAPAEWFMDHRNADGSTAEMCGNGIRLFARYLVAAGLARPGPLRVLTRAGVRELDVEPGDGLITVDMGPAEVGGSVEVDGAAAQFVSMGNPHAVLPVASVQALGALDPDRKDLNVEYVEDVSPTHLRMRVHERGVGETRSCGTGACAAVVATAVRTGAARGTPFDVDVPGGRLRVTWGEDGRVRMTGPAVLVAQGVLTDELLEDE
jgi:diaminopimelate epimerase